jgi:tetratricopeptide (TPR) repeat protein
MELQLSSPSISTFNKIGGLGSFYRNNRNQESIDKYEEVIKNEPGNIQHYVSLGLAYQFSKQYDKAWKTIESAFKIDKNNALLLYFAGEICKCLGKYEDAIAFWDKSFEIDNEMPDNLFSKAFLYQELGEKEKAKQLKQKWMKPELHPYCYYHPLKFNFLK